MWSTTPIRCPKCGSYDLNLEDAFEPKWDTLTAGYDVHEIYSCDHCGQEFEADVLYGAVLYDVTEENRTRTVSSFAKKSKKPKAKAKGRR